VFELSANQTENKSVFIPTGQGPEDYTRNIRFFDDTKALGWAWHPQRLNFKQYELVASAYALQATDAKIFDDKNKEYFVLTSKDRLMLEGRQEDPPGGGTEISPGPGKRKLTDAESNSQEPEQNSKGGLSPTPDDAKDDNSTASKPAAAKRPKKTPK
jgi:hypothetical protein